ncbi:MAG: cytochrome P450 [Rhodococcus sp.]|nr:cytochrome P450 [Rhodococcus sp. (in: high G+C Gram-positive bacteria)]
MSTKTKHHDPLPDVIPHPRYRFPLVGDITAISTSKPTQAAMRTSRNVGSPIFEQSLFGTRFVLTTSPECVADLSDESRFAKYVSPFVDALRGLAGDGLFTAYNHELNWDRAHNLLHPAFAQNAMKSYHDTMVAVADELVEHWDSHVGTAVDVSSDMTKLTLETIGRAGFSYSFDSFRRDQLHPFVASMVEGLRFAQLQSFKGLPLIGKYLFPRATKRNDDALAYLVDVVDTVIRERQEDYSRNPDGERPNDLLEIMLRATREGDENRVDDRNIRNQVLTFLVAGHETTSGALSFALYYLSQNPDIFAKARAEVDDVWGEGSPSFAQVPKLRYVRRVLDETLRLWPTAPAYARAAREDTVLAGKYPMAKDDWVVILLPGLHRDRVWGPDPERFDPDNFLPERVRARPAHVYKPFGTGERACIGRQFAIHEAVIVLGTILRRYDLEPDPTYDLRVSERLTLMPEGFTLKLRRR